MNSINLTGNICNEVELKQTNSGKAVMQFNLAVKRPFTKDTTDFIPVVVWEQPAEYLSRYARKGTKVAVTGKLTTRNYEDKNGNKRTAFEVVADTAEICEPAGKNDPAQAATANPDKYIPDAYKSQQEPKFEPMPPNEQLPF